MCLRAKACRVGRITGRFGDLRIPTGEGVGAHVVLIPDFFHRFLAGISGHLTVRYFHGLQFVAVRVSKSDLTHAHGNGNRGRLGDVVFRIGDGDLGVVHGQRAIRADRIVGDFLLAFIGIGGGDDHAGRIESLTGKIRSPVRVGGRETGQRQQLPLGFNDRVFCYGDLVARRALIPGIELIALRRGETALRKFKFLALVSRLGLHLTVAAVGIKADFVFFPRHDQSGCAYRAFFVQDQDVITHRFAGPDRSAGRLPDHELVTDLDAAVYPDRVRAIFPFRGHFHRSVFNSQGSLIHEDAVIFRTASGRGHGAATHGDTARAPHSVLGAGGRGHLAAFNLDRTGIDTFFDTLSGNGAALDDECTDVHALFAFGCSPGDDTIHDLQRLIDVERFTGRRGGHLTAIDGHIITDINPLALTGASGHRRRYFTTIDFQIISF